MEKWTIYQSSWKPPIYNTSSSTKVQEISLLLSHSSPLEIFVYLLPLELALGTGNGVFNQASLISHRRSEWYLSTHNAQHTVILAADFLKVSSFFGCGSLWVFFKIRCWWEMPCELNWRKRERGSTVVKHVVSSFSAWFSDWAGLLPNQLIVQRTPHVTG